MKRWSCQVRRPLRRGMRSDEDHEGYRPPGCIERSRQWFHYDGRLGKSRWPPSRCKFSSPAQVGKTIVARYYNESCEEVLMQEPARSDAPVLAASSARCSLAIVAPVVQLWRFVLGRQEHTKTGSKRWRKERRMRFQKSIRKLIAKGPRHEQRRYEAT